MTTEHRSHESKELLLNIVHQRDELLIALKTLANEAEKRAGVPKRFIVQARDAIAKAKGGAE